MLLRLLFQRVKKMNKIEILGAKETLYVEHLDNGLDIYMIPNNKVKN